MSKSWFPRAEAIKLGEAPSPRRAEANPKTEWPPHAVEGDPSGQTLRCGGPTMPIPKRTNLLGPIGFFQILGEVDRDVIERGGNQ
jgi:hypothetical protein